MAAQKEQRQSQLELSSSVQANDLRSKVNGVMVGENREHLSLLRGNRRQLQQHKYDRALKETSVMTDHSEPTSANGEEIENVSEDRVLNISVLVRNRMTSYCRLIRSRRPKGKGVLLILIISFLESFAYFGVLTGVKRLLPARECQGCQSDLEGFVLSLLYSSAGRVFYPVAGVIADSYLGRYTVIHIGLWLMWVGFALSALFISLLRFISSAPTAGTVYYEYIMAIVAVILYSAGSGSVEATVIPFGADQLASGASSDELSSYFYYYYIARNTAVFIVTLVLFTVFDEITFTPHEHPHSEAGKLNTDTDYVIQNLLAILAVTLALLILLYFRKQFYRDKQHSNALRLVTRVLCYAARAKRQIPQQSRAFRYGGALTPRIDLAKEENDGTFTGEEVEDVKTFYRMLLLILSLFGYFITYGAGFAYMSFTLSTAASNFIQHTHGHALNYLATNTIWIINSGSISIALPIINHFLIPLRPTLNIRLKIGVGFLLHVLSFGIAALIQWQQEHLYQYQFFYLMVVPMLVLSVGETTVFVSSLEFIYAQSPNNMKGLQTGMFYLIYGIFSAIGSTVYFGYLNSSNSKSVVPDWSVFCLILVTIGVVGLVVYIVVACCYKNRRRPATDEADALRRLMYANVYGSIAS